ncbi:MAG: hypothetical protein ACRD1L_05010 [Terriglobales bacterium]
MDAKPYDFRRDRRWRNAVITLVVLALLAGVWILFWPRFMARRTVDRFFQSLERKNYQEAYAIWQPDPKAYPMDAFMSDWGPKSQWGTITRFHIAQLGVPPPRLGGHASGLVALVEINGNRTDEARIWIENGSRVLSFYQY